MAGVDMVERISNNAWNAPYKNNCNNNNNNPDNSEEDIIYATPGDCETSPSMPSRCHINLLELPSTDEIEAVDEKRLNINDFPFTRHSILGIYPTGNFRFLTDSGRQELHEGL